MPTTVQTRNTRQKDAIRAAFLEANRPLSPDEALAFAARARSAQTAATRSRRVASSRRRADQTASLNKRETTHAAAAAQAEIDRSATVDVQIQAHAMLGRALWKMGGETGAAAEYAKVRRRRAAPAS